MLNKRKMLNGVVLILTVLFSATFFTLPLTVEGKTDVVTIEGMSYGVNSSLADNLKALTGKKVYVTLNSGKTFAGFVKQVGDHLLHLEKLDGKEYFDALIRLESISAIDTRFREYQR